MGCVRFCVCVWGGVGWVQGRAMEGCRGAMGGVCVQGLVGGCVRGTVCGEGWPVQAAPAALPACRRVRAGCVP